MEMVPLNISAQDVLNALFNADETVCFRIFDDKKRGMFKGLSLECACSRYTTTMEKALHDHNKMDRGIFFVVNYGGQKDEDITRINAQFVESDELSFEEMGKCIDAFPLPPSMVIKTSKSLHTYWFMKGKPEVSRFRTIQKQLVKQFDGDIKCQNESRVMRLPGFYHCKQNPVMVSCVLFHPERKYTQDELAAVLPKIEEDKPTEKMTGSEKGLSIVMHECDFLKHCKSDAKTLSEHDWYAMITNLAGFEGGVDMIHALSHDYPKYSEAETTEKINHFLKSGTRPITCKTIAEKGFKCPRLENGECKCKAPAALCYLPVSIEGLEALVAELPITNMPLADMETASKYVEEYLYNQDVTIASAVINDTLKKHFKFSATDVRALLSSYKMKNREYRSGLKSRQHKVSDELPLWYLPTERGLKFMPKVLADDMTKNEKVIYAAEQHYLYEEGVYVPIPEMTAQRMVQEKMLAQECRFSQITDAEKQWRLQVCKEIRELNSNPFMINVKNGVYNVLEGKLYDHSPDLLSTIQLNVRYAPEADCPLFKKFLYDSMEGDEAQVRLLQEMLGYFLVPITKAQKCFVIVGAAGAGKSVLLNVLNEILLGGTNVSNVSWQALNERFKPAELFGKLANIFADLPTKNIDDNGIFKALVGEDYLTVEKKNKDPFSFQCTARLLFSCNNIPRNYGDKSEGFYRRLIIIRFNHTVPEKDRDPDLLDKFRGEADGIFRFALEGLRALMDNGYHFDETEKNKAELQRYKEDSDSVLSFIADCVEEKSGSVVPSTELFNKYKKYCEDAGMKAYAQNNFTKQLLEAIPSAERGKDSLGNRRVIKNIIITDELL
ncbi:MAG: phage/plasmid primase, P4 family [Lachnospiraceae bacterium]|jgi:putative DNA primase/helicase|nr:phage/plasmid primase, P4 family [Lachnospiraceae bacterium]